MVPINWYYSVDYVYNDETIANFPQTNLGLILWEQVKLKALTSHDTDGGRGGRYGAPRPPPRRSRRMTSYIIRRLLLIIPTVFFALSFLFFLFFVLPGDPATLIAGGGDRTVDPASIERVEERYGLDDPLLEQFVDYWERTIQWDLGESFLNRRSVNDILGEKAVNSIRLGIWAIIIEIVVGIARRPALGHPAVLDHRQAHHDRHRGRVRHPGVRAGLHPPVRVRRLPEQARLAGVGAPAHVAPRARHVDLLLHPDRRAVALPDPARRHPGVACPPRSPPA